MAGSLAGVDLRLERANKCLGLLERLRRDHLTKPYEIVGHHDVEAREYVFRIDREPPSLRWGLILSEFAHSLRASLDNLIWQLVLARGNVPGRHNSFPIYEHPTDSKRKSNTLKAVDATRGVLPDDFTFIEAYQPYNVRDDPNLSTDGEREVFAAYQPLAMLSYLDNVDKHRYLMPGLAAARGIGVLYGYGPRQFKPVLFTTDRLYIGWGDRDFLPLIDGFPNPGLLHDPKRNVAYDGWWSSNDDDPTEIARAYIGQMPRRAKPNVKMYSRLTLEISFSDSHRPMTIFDLRDIRAEVEGIIEYFRPVIG